MHLRLWCSCFICNIAYFHLSSVCVHTCYEVISKRQLIPILGISLKTLHTQPRYDILGNTPKIEYLPTKLFPTIINQNSFIFSFMFFHPIQICVCVHGCIYTVICLHISMPSYFKSTFHPSVSLQPYQMLTQMY